jgi:hypothetical protein
MTPLIVYTFIAHEANDLTVRSGTGQGRADFRLRSQAVQGRCWQRHSYQGQGDQIWLNRAGAGYHHD